jgi:threonine/homoserine/homoserine lactone efflux protein
MEFGVFLALLGFTLAATITPGPNNIMVMASGANFGFGRTIPHLLGVSAGALAILLLVGLGLTALLDGLPILGPVLRIVSSLYLLWLAWKIAKAASPKDGGPERRPLTFAQAALFQWVNPKIWVTGLSAMSLFAGDRAFASAAIVAVTMALIGLGANALWTWLGISFGRWLNGGGRLRLFNIAMAVLLVASLYPVLL